MTTSFVEEVRSAFVAADASHVRGIVTSSGALPGTSVVVQRMSTPHGIVESKIEIAFVDVRLPKDAAARRAVLATYRKTAKRLNASCVLTRPWGGTILVVERKVN